MSLVQLASARLLLVDDDPSAIHTLRNVLSDYEDVRFATSGMQALQLAESEPPDLILLDAEMPEMDGLAVCRTLKSSPRLRDIPVIFVTSHGSSEMETKALDLGAADFLSKPVESAQVNARVRAQLRLRQLAESRREVTDRLELALSAGRLGAWGWTLATDEMLWHESMAQIRGDLPVRVRRFQDHVLGLDTASQQNLRDAFEKILKTLRPVTVDYSIVLQGDLRQIRCRMRPVQDVDGQLSGVAGIDHDVTEWHRANTLLKSANRQLEQFAYFTSHDLQAPARQMGLFAKIAIQKEQHGDAAGLRETLGHIQKSSERMQRQIQSFLDLSRHRLTEAGEWRHGNMLAVVEPVLADLRHELDRRHTIVHLEPMSEVFVPVNLLSHVWRNLLSNAIKHQVADAPAIWIGETLTDEGLAYYVEDAGESAASDETAGTGLGFEICHHVLRVLNGRLWSERGRSGGMKMLFTLGGTDQAAAPDALMRSGGSLPPEH